MNILDTLTTGRWIRGKDAIPAVSGSYAVLVRAEDGLLELTSLDFNDQDLAWQAPDPEAWFLPDSEAVRLAQVISKAREILDSVPTEWPEVSPSDPALYDHLAAIRNARAVLGEA